MEHQGMTSWLLWELARLAVLAAVGRLRCCQDPLAAAAEAAVVVAAAVG
jgi:hypothetical protein